MACGYSDLTANIQLCGSQRAVKGLDDKCWIANVGNLVFTFSDNMITNITKVATKRAFVVDSLKDQTNVGFDGVISDTNVTGYKNSLTLIANAKTAATKLQFDTIDNIVAIVKKNGAETEGCFVALGVKFGLWKTSDAQKANDNNAQRTIELASRDGIEEAYSEYVVWKTDYATTLAMLIA